MVLWHNLPQVLQVLIAPIMSPSPTQFQTWQGYRYAYELQAAPVDAGATGPPLLLIHPVGVGLSRRFWHRFCSAWREANAPHALYNPDLLGCGESDMPALPYCPQDWAQQLAHLLDGVIQQPVIVVVQGALLPVALELAQLRPEQMAGLVLSGPPAWSVMTDVVPPLQQNILWALLRSPLGRWFYRYARRRAFLRRFSQRQLFAENYPIPDDWLDPLVEDAQDMDSRYAVFAFLARFWQRGYGDAIKGLVPPTLALFGEQASSVSRSGQGESPRDRLDRYLDALPAGQGALLPGRNVLPFEATAAFVAAVAAFAQQVSQRSSQG